MPFTSESLRNHPFACLPVAIQRRLSRSTYQAQAPSYTGGVRLYHLALPRLPTTTHVSPFPVTKLDACGSITALYGVLPSPWSSGPADAPLDVRGQPSVIRCVSPPWPFCLLEDAFPCLRHRSQLGDSVGSCAQRSCLTTRNRNTAGRRRKDSLAYALYKEDSKVSITRPYFNRPVLLRHCYSLPSLHCLLIHVFLRQSNWIFNCLSTQSIFDTLPPCTLYRLYAFPRCASVHWKTVSKTSVRSCVPLRSTTSTVPPELPPPSHSWVTPCIHMTSIMMATGKAPLPTTFGTVQVAGMARSPIGTRLALVATLRGLPAFGRRATKSITSIPMAL